MSDQDERNQSVPEDEREDAEDFARMLDESLEPETHAEGQMVEGRIVALGADVAFVDVGGKGEATIDIDELRDSDGELDVEVGDIVQGVVVSTRGGLRLSHKLARGAVSRQRLEDAYAAGLPVEGRVAKSIKGGYEIRIGEQRAFCPISQIDNAFTEDPSVHEGQLYTFRIVEFKREGKDLVVSRRALLEEEEQERAAEVRASIVPGAVLPGRVASVRPYGAFIDLGGGIQGLLHVSEMGWSRVSDPNQVVQPGDEIQVQVLGVDDEKGRISLGLKQLQADPWSKADERYAVGQVLRAQVTRLADFGAFLELEPGIEALAHASTFPPTGKRDGWKETLQDGDSVAVEVLSIDVQQRRIGVAVVEEGSVRERTATPSSQAAIVAGSRIRGRVERHESYGVFVFLAPGRTGLIHHSETGVEKESDLKKLFPVGSEIDVLVLEVEPDGRRIKLSRQALLDGEQRKQAQEYAARQEGQQSEGFGSLAEKLRAAMERKDRDK
jgi:small subunit ribosomal protein S1